MSRYRVVRTLKHNKNVLNTYYREFDELQDATHFFDWKDKKYETRAESLQFIDDDGKMSYIKKNFK